MLVLALAMLLGACGRGTVIVEHAYQAEAMLRDASGRAVETGEIVTVPRPPGILILFDWLEYRADDFVWDLGAPVGRIVNRTEETLCARFDQARVTSSAHPEPVPLQVSTWARLIDGKWNRLAYDARLPREYFVPPPLCVGPRGEARYAYAMDKREIFPSGRLFDTRLQGDAPILLDKGIGRWLSLWLPVEVGSRRRTFEVKLTVVDSGARIGRH